MPAPGVEAYRKAIHEKDKRRLHRKTAATWGQAGPFEFLDAMMVAITDVAAYRVAHIEKQTT